MLQRNLIIEFKYFGRVVLFSALGKIQGVTEKLANTRRQSHQVFLAATQPCEWFFFDSS